MTTLAVDERHAVIDVGTNSVKLLVADVGHLLKPVLKLSRHARLGQGVFRTGRLQPAAIARTVTAVAELAAKAAELHPASLRVLATSATREAANGHELVQAIHLATGLKLEIISGDQEAEYVFHGVTSDPAIGLKPVLIVDVGGGSTEWVLGEGGFIYFTLSTKLGTRRLLELYPPSDPPTPEDLDCCRGAAAEFLRGEVYPRLRPVLAAFRGRPLHLIGVGGALKALAQLDTGTKGPGNGPLLLSREHVRRQVERLWRYSSQERRGLSHLNPEKADVILAGAVIYEAILDQFEFAELLVFSCGLRSGALMCRTMCDTLTHSSTSAPAPAALPPGWSGNRPETAAAGPRI